MSAYGSGKRFSKGTAAVVIRDKLGIIYGWHTLEKIAALPEKEKEKEFAFLEIEIELEVLLAYLEVYFKNAPGVQAILRLDIVTHEMLRAIDREIILYQSDCEALEKLTRDYVAGKIPGADYLDRNHD